MSNAGGAVGFPFLPVSDEEVTAAFGRLLAEVTSGSVLLFVAEMGDEVVGWVSLRLNRSELTKHWAVVQHLQSRPEVRGQRVGKQLLDTVVDHARSIGVEQLWLAIRGAEGLETFYEKFGWQEIGRHPGALRLSPTDDRDEVVMVLQL